MALERELGQALGLFARAARTRHLYGANNQVRVKMLAEVVRAFGRIFENTDSISLSVRHDAFLFEDEPVLEEDADPSVPFLFFRDGVRRLELARGLTEHEIEVLLDATSSVLSRRGLDDDLVSILWRHQLDHLRYVTVDTTVTDADMGDPDRAVAIDAQIDALIRSIYGGATDDGTIRSIHIDSSDITARGIADALGSVDEMAPGFFPPKHFIAAPAYAERFTRELEEEDDAAVLDLAASAAVEALARTDDSIDVEPLVDALLAIFDSALLERRLDLLKRIIDWIGALDPSSQKVRTFLESALSEARVRQLASLDHEDPASEAEVLAFLQSCGPMVVPAVIALLPSLTDPRQRRAYSDLALRLGTQDLAPIFRLLASEQGYVAAEALHMLADMGKIDRRAAREAAQHPKPQVRLTALQIIDRLPPDAAEELVLRLLDDREPRVRTEALQQLTKIDGARAKGAIEASVARDDFEEASAPVKEAFLRAYVTICGRHAFDRLEAMIDATDRRLARRQVEELGAAAVLAIASMPSTRTVEVLKRACMSRNKRVRELARAELKKMRRDFE